MNNDIAVEILRELWRYKTTDKYTEIEIRRALETAIEAVNGLRPHGEMRLIDADALTKQLEEMADNEWNKSVGSSKGLEDAIDVVESMPTIKTFTLADIEEQYRKGLEKGLEERPHGEWVLDKEISFVFNIYECSKCRFNGSKRWHFCPNCGADMRKEGDEK